MSVFKDTLRLKGNKSQGTDTNTEDQKYCISPSKFREQGKWRQSSLLPRNKLYPTIRKQVCVESMCSYHH